MNSVPLHGCGHLLLPLLAHSTGDLESTEAQATGVGWVFMSWNPSPGSTSEALGESAARWWALSEQSTCVQLRPVLPGDQGTEAASGICMEVVSKSPGWGHLCVTKTPLQGLHWTQRTLHECLYHLTADCTLTSKKKGLSV